MLPFERVQHAAAGDFVRHPGVDRLRAEVSGSVVGAAAVADGRHPHDAQPGASRGRGGFHRGRPGAPGFAHRQPQAARALEGDAAHDQRSARGAFQFRLQPGAGRHPAGALGAQLRGESRVLGRGVGRGHHGQHRPAAVGQQPGHAIPAQGVAGCGHLRALLRGPAGHPGDCSLALLRGDLRPRRIPAEHCLPDRASARRKKNRPPRRPPETARARQEAWETDPRA